MKVNNKWSMDFIDRFNDLTPSTEEIILRYREKVGVELGMDTATGYQSKMMILKVGLQEVNTLSSLIENTNFWKIGVGSLVFNASYSRVDHDYFEIGSYNESYSLLEKNECTFIQIGDSKVQVFNSGFDFLDFILFYKKLNVSKFYKLDSLDRFNGEMEDWIKRDISKFLILELFLELGYNPRSADS